ncbi:hypothetical protein E2542_SST22491 [Spatholobus suberectus]|nr:hypothetical protein E2542_SST22491 [Spatholobus suberectus]
MRTKDWICYIFSQFSSRQLDIHYSHDLSVATISNSVRVSELKFALGMAFLTFVECINIQTSVNLLSLLFPVFSQLFGGFVCTFCHFSSCSSDSDVPDWVGTLLPTLQKSATKADLNSEI